jgi:thiol-disulfide isomerase/thioredoxin
MEDYYKKYLKYKSKYIYLKNLQKGGGDKIDLMLFKAEWCGYCKTFLPVWNSLKKMDNFKSKFNFITYDSDEHKNEFEQYKVNEYPTLIIKKDEKNFDEYSGPREMEHMIEFLENL